MALTDKDCSLIHIVGSDRMVQRTRVVKSGEDLTLDIKGKEGVKVKVPFRNEGRTPTLLSTCALRTDNPTPYRLLLEIARGSLLRIKNLTWACRDANIELSESIRQAEKDAVTFFAEAVVCPQDSNLSDENALKSLSRSLDGLDQLEPIFTQASNKANAAADSQRAFLRGLILERPPTAKVDPLLQLPLNTVVVSPSWKQCEPESGKFKWNYVEKTLDTVIEKRLTTMMGPIIQLDEMNTPEWLYLWENDFEEMISAAMRYAKAVVEKFGDRVNLWYCAAGINDELAIKLREEERLRLILGVIQAMRQTGTRIPLLASFSRPWGEYMAETERELAPIHFAEELVRARLGVTGIGLELNFSNQSPGTYFRSYFDIEEMLNFWSLLGVPLFISLSVPSSWRPDSKAHYSSDSESEPPERISRRTQREYVAKILPALLSHPQVQGVFWNQVSDEAPHRFAHAGLLDQQGQPKSTLRTVNRILTKYFPAKP